MHFDEARSLLAEHIEPLPPTTVALEKAAGLRLAEPAEAVNDLPPFDAAAMDGYAARAQELQAGETLPVAFEVAAGAEPKPLPPGSVARIFTGAPIPPGADTVVPQEKARRSPDGTVLLEPLPAGANLRRHGELVGRGESVVAPRERLTPQRIGLLAAVGRASVSVFPRPRLAVVVTGSELAGVSEPLPPGKIRNSNGPMLLALAREAGVAVECFESSADTLVHLEGVLRRAADRADVILTSGGVSVGKYDLVPEAVQALGGEVLLHKVRMKPGKPILVARLEASWFVGLPGNPLAVLVGWRFFARPLIEALAGDPEALNERPVAASLVAPVRNAGRRVQLAPARLRAGSSEWAVEPVPWRGSHDLVAAAAADAVIRLEPETQHDAGEEVPVYPLTWRE